MTRGRCTQAVCFLSCLIQPFTTVQLSAGGGCLQKKYVQININLSARTVPLGYFTGDPQYADFRTSVLYGYGAGSKAPRVLVPATF